MPAFKPSSPPEGCHHVETHERKLTELADLLDERAKAWLRDGESPILASRAKELALAAVRARKIASELALKRLEVDYGRWLVAERRALGGTRRR